MEPRVVEKRKAEDEDSIDSLFLKHLKLDPILVKKFMDACKTNDVVKLNLYLKEQNVSPHMMDDESKTPLIVAIISGSNDAAVTLIKCKNSNFNHRDIYGNNAIYYACGNKNYEIIKLLLKIPNINVDTVKENITFMTDPIINSLYTKASIGGLKKFSYSKFNPREVEDNPQRQFRAALSQKYKGCMITGTPPEDCDFIHICNPTKNKLTPYEISNGLILSQKFYRQYYKKNLIKFNIERINQISDTKIGVELVTSHPEIIQYNGKIVEFDISSMKYFMYKKPKPTIKKNYKKGDIKKK